MVEKTKNHWLGKIIVGQILLGGVGTLGDARLEHVSHQHMVWSFSSVEGVSGIPQSKGQVAPATPPPPPVAPVTPPPPPLSAEVFLPPPPLEVSQPPPGKMCPTFSIFTLSLSFSPVFPRNPQGSSEPRLCYTSPVFEGSLLTEPL